MGEWTKKFRELGKKGGSSKDFKKLYFKMKLYIKLWYNTYIKKLKSKDDDHFIY